MDRNNLPKMFLNVILLLAIFAIATGCDTLSGTEWERIGDAARNAASSPATWVPAAGALAFQAGRSDQNVSRWAATRTPVYGSRDRAENASNYLLAAEAAKPTFTTPPTYSPASP